MLYSSEQLLKLQNIEIEIAKEIIRICELNDIKYFSVGGTTLGAIRHDGFIPWDDDMDIGMYRSDYDKFLSIAPGQLQEGFVLQHYSVESKTPTYHAKVMKQSTQFVEAYAEHIDIPHGVFVDIMPFDNIPTEEDKLVLYRKAVKKYHQLFIAKSVWKTSLTRGKKKYFYTLIRLALHIFLIPVPKKYIYEKLESEIRRYNGTETGRMSSRGLKVFECDKSDVFPAVDHIFGAITIKTPNNYDAILKQQYGDYMTLPPKSQRVGHAPLKLKV